MADSPLVSIITATFNHEKYIAQCLASALAQTYPDLELIVVDDASQDGTPGIIQELAEKDKRIKAVIHTDNWGIGRLGETYNQALDISRGPLIAILEGDDFWPKEKLARQINSFERKNVVLSWSRAALTDDRGTILGVRPLKKMRADILFNRPQGAVLKELLYRNIIPPVTVVMRKDAVLSIGGFPSRTGLSFIDYPTFLKMSLTGEFDFIDDIMGYWRRHPGQATLLGPEDFAVKASRFAQGFLADVPGEIRRKYCFSPAKVKRKEKGRIAFSLLAEARAKLAERRWNDAQRDFRLAFNKAPIMIKPIALAGIVLSSLQIDFKFSGRERR